MVTERAEFDEMLDELRGENKQTTEGIEEKSDEGYSSMEIPEPKQAAAEVEVKAAETKSFHD